MERADAGTSMQIRDIELPDSSAIFQIIDSSHKADRYPLGPVWTPAQVEAECREASGLIGFEPQGAILGFILYRDSFEAWEISFLATTPSARGRGVMKMLLKTLADRRPKGKALWLEVHEQNEPARRLYESFGFRLVGKRLKYYADGGTACLYNYG